MTHVDVLTCLFLLVVHGGRCQVRVDKAMRQFCSCWHLDNVEQRIHKDDKTPSTDVSLRFDNCSDPRNTSNRYIKNMTFAIDVWAAEDESNKEREEYYYYDGSPLLAEQSVECNITQKTCVHSMQFKMSPNDVYVIKVYPYCGPPCDPCRPIEYHFSWTMENQQTKRKREAILEARSSDPDTRVPLLVVSIVFLLLFITVVSIALFKYRRTTKYTRSEQRYVPEVELNLINAPERPANNTSVTKQVFVATHPLDPKCSEDQRMIDFINILQSFTQLDINYLSCFDLNMLESISVNIQDSDVIVLVLSPELVSLCVLATQDDVSVHVHSQEVRYMLTQIEHFCRRCSDSKPLYLVNLEPAEEHIATLKKTKLFQNIPVLFNMKDMSKTDDHLQKLIHCLLPKY